MGSQIWGWLGLGIMGALAAGLIGGSFWLGKQRSRDSRWMLLLLISGLLMAGVVVVQGVEFYVVTQLQSRGIVAEARVVGMDHPYFSGRQHRGSSRVGSYYVEYKFSTDEARTLTVKERVPAGLYGRLSVGQEVEILYLPDHPQTARIREFNDATGTSVLLNLGLVLMTFLLIAGMLVVTPILFRFYNRPAGRRERRSSNPVPDLPGRRSGGDLRRGRG